MKDDWLQNLEKYSLKQYLWAKSGIGMNDLEISRSWFSKLISRENQNLNDKRNNHKASLHILNKLMNATVNNFKYSRKVYN